MVSKLHTSTSSVHTVASSGRCDALWLLEWEEFYEPYFYERKQVSRNPRCGRSPRFSFFFFERIVLVDWDQRANP